MNPQSPGFLSGEDYATVIRCVPILCVDIVLRLTGSRDYIRTVDGKESSKYVLFKRNNEPLKNEWWVVGGRVYKGEMAETAARRKLFEECRLMRGPGELRFLGFYQEVFAFSSIGRGEYHTLSLVFEAEGDPGDIKLDGQHSEWMLSDRLPQALAICVGESK